jgi:hypothetical protein
MVVRYLLSAMTRNRAESLSFRWWQGSGTPERRALGQTVSVGNIRVK